ncbi:MULTISPECIES: flavoprotein [unclassified Streptomyces]|uniref:flavoprotein n=1 Tax=unclassified Streptomyces TaxID=2593676 RepID=UPI00081ED36F|nr:flavoprotein [Streptomyces sp. ScaeMP-e83]MYR93637.1 flavoprotein [Streptomyces sp. SID4937]SCD56449.1 Flavoprotein [Streptomyces sp. ScaeMP-e83]
MNEQQVEKPLLYVVVCAAGIAGEVGLLITEAQQRGWDVVVVATPQGLGFIDAPAVEAQTGYPIRSAWRSPGEPRPLPAPDAIAVVPATFNTVNKWAAGISDTLALGILCESYGLGVPTAVLPYVNSAQAAHPAYAESLRRLRDMGILIGSYEPHRPKAGGGADCFRWEEALELLTPRMSRQV